MPRARMERRSRFFSLLVALFLALPAFDNAAAAAGPEAIGAALDKINRFRAGQGLGALTADRRLTAAARRHARAMADRDFFGHVGADGSDIGMRVSAAGYVWKLVAENIAAGMTDADAAVETWIDSPGHRRNLLLADAVHIGLAHVRADDDPGTVTYRDYWVLLLAAPQ